MSVGGLLCAERLSVTVRDRESAAHLAWLDVVFAGDSEGEPVTDWSWPDAAFMRRGVVLSLGPCSRLVGVSGPSVST